MDFLSVKKVAEQALIISKYGCLVTRFGRLQCYSNTVQHRWTIGYCIGCLGNVTGTA